jgi:putative ABC transport system permease protein
MWPLVRFVSLRHIAAAKLRSLLTLLGVALGVAMLIGMTAANGAVLSSFEEMVDRASGKADLEVTGDESGVDQALVDELGGHTELLSHVAGRIEQTSFLEGGEDGLPGDRVLVLGVDFLGDKAFLPFKTESGADLIADPLAFLNDPQAILISDTLAKSRGLKAGSTLKLRTAQGMSEFHVESVLGETGKSQAFGGQLVILFLDAAQLAFAREGHVDRIDIQLAKGVSVDDALPKLQAMMGTRGQVARPEARGTTIAGMTASFRLGLQAQALLALLVGMFLIYNAVSVSVAQRRREIGILRSLGVTQWAITRVFLVEALVLGVVGGAIGVALGDWLAKVVVAQFAPAVSRFYQSIPTPVPHVTLRLALSGVAAGLVATLFAAYVPARRAAHTSPVETLRRDLHAHAAARPPVRAMLGMAVALSIVALAITRLHVLYIGFASVFLLTVAAALATPMAVVLLAKPAAVLAQRTLGLSARLGVDNVSRELGRSALTACALVLATSMSVTVACYAHSYEASCMAWVEQAVPADVVITAGSPLADRNAVPFADDLGDKVKDVPGVREVDRVRSLTVPYGPWRIELASLETHTYLKNPVQLVLDGPKPLPLDALEHEPSVLVSENFHARTGLRAGDTVELPSPTGAHRFKIVAVVVDYSSDQGWMLVDRRYMIEFWKDSRVEAVDLYTAPGADPYAVAAAVRARLASAGEGGMFVTTNAALKDEVRHVIRQTFEISKASEFVALFVAVLGVIGTMLAAVIDRIREIGVLRAIGATRRQILFAVMAEAGFLGVCAALVGTAVAIPSALLFVDTVGFQATGWSVPFRFPAGAVVRVVSAVVLFSIASGFLPGWRAARLKITSALAYE